jgi:xanthine dehydrogenase accessory factor
MIKGELVHQVEALNAAREPFVYATVVRAAAPTSVRPGDSALVLADGTIEGFVGGMCAQASVRLHAIRAMETGDSLLLRLVPGTVGGSRAAGDDPMAQDGVVVVNNPCLSGGALEIFLEPQLPAPRVVVAGGTPIAKAVEQVAAAAGFDVVPVDPGDVDPRSTDAAMIVASHGTDEEAALTRALEAGVGYVALVASRRRGRAVIEALDVPDALRDQVRTPAGLDIGARTPGEIAISILAEVIAQRTAHPMPPVRPATGATASEALPVTRVAAAAAAAATAVDPVCGMEVVAAEATVHLDVGGERVYFCCEGCRSTYAAERAPDAGAEE